jgi:pectate lyase
MNKNKMVSIMAIALIVVAGAFFFGGMKYAQAKAGKNMTGQAGNFQRGAGTGGNRPGGARGTAGGFTGGTVVSKDATSITVKARDGSSKIVFYTKGTPVMKTIPGSGSDIEVGKDITVTGTPNSDGSVSAETIQLRAAPPTQAPSQQ